MLRVGLLKKQRIDILLVERGLAPSRQKAQSLVMSGKVIVNRQPVDKSGTLANVDDDIEIKGDFLPYVSRGGLKLEAALDAFQIDVNHCTCLDVGASTGGFCDCLLQRGALRVYAVDVGYGQLAWPLRQDPRVIVIERTNIRHMPFERIGKTVDIVTVDVSFISLKIVVPVLMAFLKKTSILVPLIKPQFEVGKGRVGKGGVVRDPDLQRQVVEDLTMFFDSIHLDSHGVIESPLLGPKGNREFLMMLRPKTL